tara:strand:- start:531 stop:806 length:276 start_codon:yes stop_codon:yes gene_type:complete
MSPAQHHIHHSTAKEHIDKNFGVALSVWDWMYGSLSLSKAEGQLRFGLSEEKSHAHHSMKGLYIVPLQQALEVFLRLFSRLPFSIYQKNSA